MQNWLNKDIKKSFNFHKKALIIVLGLFGGFFTYIFSKIIQLKPEGIFIGQPNSWSDWVVHISITNIFANKPISEWFLYHPFFANGKLTYGFLSHLITAMFMRVGLRIDSAFFIVSVLLSLFFLSGLYFLYFQISKSRKQSILGIFIFLTSSGMGIFRYINHISINQLLFPTKDYSSFVQYDWLAGNILEAMIIPQRAFFIGVTLGVWVINLLFWGLKSKEKLSLFKNRQMISTKQKYYLFAGLIAGLLPIAHMHSFITIVIVSGIICLFNKHKYKDLIYFVLPAGIISTVLYFCFIHGGIQIDDFMTITLGWTANKNILTSVGLLASIFNWIIMWLQVWGVFLPTVIFSYFYFQNDKQFQKTLPIFFGFMTVFLISNIVIFQPTAWDNTKLFAWVYLGLSIFVAKLIFKLWSKNLRLKMLVIILMILLSSTGVVSILRIINFEQNTFMLSSTSEVLFAKQIAQNTQTDAIFLTSTNHNHPIPLWANRPIYLGYLGWVRNFGFDHTQRAKNLNIIFSGQKNANKVIIDNKISYIYVGPKERNSLNINEDYLEQFPIAFKNIDTKVYDTRQLWQ